MLDGKVLQEDIRTKDEILTILKKRGAFYGPAVVQTALSRRDGVWKNALTKIVVFHHKEKPPVERTLNYGNFVIGKAVVEIDELAKMMEEIIVKGNLAIRGYPTVQIEGSFERRKPSEKYLPSDEEVFKLRWPADFYLFVAKTHFEGSLPSEPLSSLDLPLFPDAITAVRNELGVDIIRYDYYRRGGKIIILLPSYKAKIDEVRIGSKQLTVKILPQEIVKEEVLGKIYCEQFGKNVRSEEVIFDEESKAIPLDFVPDDIYIHLLSKKDGELLDHRRIHLRWPTLPKGVVLEIATEEIRELIRRGENERVEFKQEISGKAEEFVETIVAFSNRSGGVVLIGVDDHANIVGVHDPKLAEESMRNIIRSRCEPPIEPEIESKEIDGKTILLVQVKEGKNKPYTHRGKGVYVRSGSTDRIATRDELDEFYRKK